MIRIVLFVALAAVAGSALSVKESKANAYNVGKTFLTTLKDLTDESEYSAVQRKLENANPEMRKALSNVFVKSDTGESQLNVKEVLKAFEEVSRMNQISSDDVLKAIADDPLYKELTEQVAKSNLYEEEEKSH